MMFAPLLLSLYAKGQYRASFNFDTCLKLALENYPLVKQKSYLEDIEKNNKKEYNGAWLPQLMVNSTATEFSEVVSFDLPGFQAFAALFPTFYNDQYNLGVDLRQTIYDGGVTAQEKRTDAAKTESEMERNEVDIYKVKAITLQIYSGILLAKENLKIIYSYTDALKSREQEITSSVNNGAMLQSNLDALQVEILNTEDKIIETKSTLNGFCQALSLLIREPVDSSASFAYFSTRQKLSSDTVKRPEMKLFELQQSELQEEMILANRKEQPRLYLFGSGDYGRPGYNFLDQNFRPYGMVGLNLTWNITGLYNLHYDKENLTIRKNMIDDEKEAFLLETQSTMARQSNDIEKLTQLVENDKLILTKRAAMSKTAADHLNNGTITASEYITQLSAEKQSAMEQQLHEIQLAAAYISYRITTGN